jgi:hypothetical protein
MAVILAGILITKPLIFIKVHAGGQTQARPGSPTSMENLIKFIWLNLSRFQAD